MANITASDGTQYHIWALPALSSPEPEDTKEFTVLSNDLSDGYRSSALFGSNTGLRSWKLKLPTLAGSSVPMPTVTDINGATVSREQYLRSLYDENTVTGTPFAYQDPNNNQYYLVDFADKSLTMQRMKYIALYGTGIELKQRRVLGKTIFDTAQMGVTAGEWDNHHAAVQWRQNNGTFNWGSFVPTGDVQFGTNIKNNLDVVSFNLLANTGYAALGSGGAGTYNTAYDMFLVMKVREATFSNVAGIITDVASGSVLEGSIGTANFADLSHTNYEYRLNDVVYPSGSQAAPMNTWGIVHLRFASGKSLNRWQLGRKLATAGTYAKVDIGDVLVTGALLPRYLVREVFESFVVKWAIT